MGGGPDSVETRSTEDGVEVTANRLAAASLDAQTDSVQAEQGSVDIRDDSAKLLYSKSKVYMHPTSYIRDNVPGYLAIVQIETKYLISWIPEGVVDQASETEKYVLVEIKQQPDAVVSAPTTTDRAFAHPINALYSVILTPPTLTSWYGSMTISLYGGEALPTLWFHDEESPSTILDRDRRASQLSARGSHTPTAPSWGGEAFISALRQYCPVLRSHIEPNLFLIHPSKQDYEVHSTPLYDDEIPSATEQRRRSILHRSLANDYPSEVPSMDNFTFSVLNSFSRLTRGARNVAETAAAKVLSHPLAKPIVKSVPEPTAQHANSDPGELTRLEETAAGAGQYDAARVYLAKWARIVAEEGERARRAEIVIHGKEGREDTAVGAFEILANTYSITRPRTTRAAGQPIVVTEWAAWFDEDGKLMLDKREALKRIFQRGLSPDDRVRRDVWPFLLEMYPWDSTTKERFLKKAQVAIQYEKCKAKWQKSSATRETEFFIEESHRIEIDCRRTDRTHPMFATEDGDVPSDLAHPPSNAHVRKMQEILLTYVFAEEGRDYVQGMSDLLSPIYVVCEGDEVLAFACFTTLMERMKRNFLRDQSGMKEQLTDLQRLLALMDAPLHKHLEDTGSLNLFFCFRWILCSFKRELSFPQTLKLWEVLWTDYYSTHFHLFVALAIIEQHRDIIMRYLQEFDEVLKYVNELSGTLDIDEVISDAEVLFATFSRVLERLVNKQAAASTGGANGLRNRHAGSVDADADNPNHDDDDTRLQKQLRKLLS